MGRGERGLERGLILHLTFGASAMVTRYEVISESIRCSDILLSLFTFQLAPDRSYDQHKIMAVLQSTPAEK